MEPAKGAGGRLKMKTCGECGKEVDSSFKFCPYCFTDFPEEEEGGEDASGGGDAGEAGEESDSEPPEEEAEEDSALFADRYILEEPLSCSSTGTVCLVRHYKNDRLYILKDFRINGRSKPEREAIGKRLTDTANALRRLQHRVLSCVIDSKYENDNFSVIYEYQSGKSIEETFEEMYIRQEEVTEEMAVRWTRDVLELLVFLQRQQKRPFCCCNLLPYSFVITDDRDIKFINIGMPIFYKETGIQNPFENRPLDNSRITPGYDIFCAGLTLLYIVSGMKAEPDPENPPEIPKDARFPLIHPIIRDMLNEYSSPNDVEELFERAQRLGEEEDVPEEEPEEKEKGPNWNIYLGNIERTNSYGQNPSPFLHLLWSLVLQPASRFYIQPAKPGLTVLSDTGNLYVLNLNKAQLIRKYRLNINAVAPVVDGSTMYINSSTGQTAVNLEKNEPLWEFRTKSMFLTPPSLTDTSIMTLSYDGFMIQVNPEDGKPLSMENIKGKVMAPVIYDDSKLYIPTLSHGLLAVNRETRVVEWELPSSAYTSGAALSRNGALYAGDGGGTVFCINSGEGRIIWKSSVNGAVVHGPVISGDKVICSSASGEVAGFDASTGEKVWKIDFATKSTPVFCASEGYLFLTSPEGTILTANADNGTVYRQIRLKGKSNSIPLAFNGLLYCSSNEGEIYAFAPRD